MERSGTQRKRKKNTMAGRACAGGQSVCNTAPLLRIDFQVIKQHERSDKR